MARGVERETGRAEAAQRAQDSAEPAMTGSILSRSLGGQTSDTLGAPPPPPVPAGLDAGADDAPAIAPGVELVVRVLGRDVAALPVVAADAPLTVAAFELP